MKTLKSVFIVVLLTFSVVGIAKSDGFGKLTPPTNVIYVSLQQAVQNPGLLFAMKQQLDPGFLSTNQQSYTVSVNYQRYRFMITGTYEEWKLFFSPLKWGPPPIESGIKKVSSIID